MKRGVGVIAGGLLVVVAACGGGSSHTVRGVFRASVGAFGLTSSDVKDGDQITAEDESGKTQGTGVLHRTECLASGEEVLVVDCYKFTIDDVGDAKFYKFEVRRHGSENFSRSELERKHWRVSLLI